MTCNTNEALKKHNRGNKMKSFDQFSDTQHMYSECFLHSTLLYITGNTIPE